MSYPIHVVAALTFLSLSTSWGPTFSEGVEACGEIEPFCFADQGDCPCGNEYSLGGCANNTGQGGILSVTGHGLVSADDLVFTASQLPASTPAIFFASRTQARLPFLNGLLCLDPYGTKILRLGPPAFTSVDGTLSGGPGLIAYMAEHFGPPAGIVLPGSTWYFQNYYRDLGHCLATANVTNAIRVRFALPPPAGVTRIGGRVFYDYEGNGAFEVGQPGDEEIEGWKIVLDDGGAGVVLLTDATGRFQFDVPMDGAGYTLRSIAPPPGFIPEPGGLWLATTPAQEPVLADAPELCIDFGKLFFENHPEFARSAGFWHHQGRDLLEACDPTWREMVNGLCLRTNVTNPEGQEGTLFTVDTLIPFDTAFDALSEYLQAPADGVLAYTLSRQFCAANLNRTCGELQGIIYIDRNDDQVLVSFEEMFAQTLGLLCDPCAANTGPGGDESCRAAIMGCLDEWDGMNSGGGSIFSRADGIPPFSYPD